MAIEIVNPTTGALVCRGVIDEEKSSAGLVFVWTTLDDRRILATYPREWGARGGRRWAR